MVAWVHGDAVLTICGAPFDGARTDALTHIACTSVQRSLPNFVRDDVKGAATRLWPDGWARTLPAVRSALAAVARTHAAALRGGCGAWPAGLPAFQVFGADFVVDAHCRPWLLELNAAPQFGDPQAMPGLRETIGRPLLQHLAEAVARSGSSGGGEGTCGGWEWLPLVDGDAKAPK